MIRLKVPDLSPKLARQAVEFVQGLRRANLRKSPSISETLDWAHALLALNASAIDSDVLDSTLSVLVKHEADLQIARRRSLAPRPAPEPPPRPPADFSGS